MRKGLSSLFFVFCIVCVTEIINRVSGGWVADNNTKARVLIFNQDLSAGSSSSSQLARNKMWLHNILLIFIYSNN